MATDQTSDLDVQALKTSVQGLQLQEVAFEGTGTKLPCPQADGAGMFLNPSMASHTLAGICHNVWWETSLSGMASKKMLETGLTPVLPANAGDIIHHIVRLKSLF